VVLGLIGLAVWKRTEPWMCRGFLAAAGVFLVFIAALAFAKGDPSWGPRYLTPVCALLWLFVPTAVACTARGIVVGLLAAGFLVQLLALSVEPARLYIERGLPSAFGNFYPEAYFHLEVAHLLNRPREIVDIARAGGGDAFTPAPTPTYAFPIIDELYRMNGRPGEGDADAGRLAIHHYAVLNTFRPWWLSQRWLPPEERPVALGATLVLLLGILLVGLAVMSAGCFCLGRTEPRKAGGP
jgi:hypothetical protein